MLKDITKDCPDAEAEIFDHGRAARLERAQADTEQIDYIFPAPSEERFAIGCLAAATIVIVLTLTGAIFHIGGWLISVVR